MSLPTSPPPTRLTAGATTDFPYGPLADSGMGNPFFYHNFFDDFDQALATGVTGLYTVSNGGGAGTAAHTPGDGGLALFSTGAAAASFVSAQLPAASFQIPQGASAGKKFFYLTRLQLSDITASAIIAGMINTTATPFAAITDGVWFSKAIGSTILNINTSVASALVTTPLPAASYTLVNATFIDLGFYIDRNGNLNVFTSPNMVGYVPQSGTGLTLPVRGKVQSILAPALPSVLTTPTLAVNETATANKTLTVDFHLAQKER
jgi:hypothetical protein